MPDLDQAYQALEEDVEGILAFVKGASYGLRLAEKRVSDAGLAGHSSGELEALVEALGQAPDRLSDLAVLAFGDFFRTYLARALEIPELPPLPSTVDKLEALAGTPGALAKAPPWLALLLQLHRVTMAGGKLDRTALGALGGKDLEIAYPGGKVKLFRLGDHVSLSEKLLEEMGQALLQAAKTIEVRLKTA